MKIRITENILRLRLNASDLVLLKNQQLLKVILPVGPNQMIFELCDSWKILNTGEHPISINDQAENELITQDQIETMQVTLEPNHLKICIHPKELQTWLNSTEMSIKTQIKHPNKHTLTIVVEKDMMG